MAVVSNVEIRVNAKNAIQQLDLIQKKTGKLPGTFDKSAAASKKLGGGMKAAGAAATGLGVALKSALAPLLAIGVAVGAVTKSFSIMGQRQADVAALENGLSNLGITGDQVLTALQAKADAFGKVTLFSEEDYTKAATQLTSFTNISVSAFDRVINVAGDVAQVMNQDVNSAVTQLAKALNAPTQNLSALSRSGIQFTEQQKEQIKALEASGQLQAAQGLILAELERQYMGAALAAGSAGLAGALDGLSEVANDAFETFGKILEPIAVPVIQGITNAIQFMSNTWAYISQVIFPEIVAAAKPLTDALMRVFSAVDVEGFGTILQNIVIRGFEYLTVVIGNVSNVVGFVIDRFVELSNTPVFKFIADQVERLAGMLGLTTDKVGEFNDAQKMSQTEADKILAAQTQITEEVQGAKEAAILFAEAQKQAADQALANAEAMQSTLKNNMDLIKAEYDLEKTILGIQKQRAEEALKRAKTVTEIIKASNKIYEITIAQARLDRALSKAKGNAAVAELALKIKVVQATKAQAEAEKAILIAKGESTAAVDAQLAKVDQQLGQMNASLAVAREISQSQSIAADAIYRQAVATAKLVRDENIRAGKERLSANLNKAIERSLIGQTSELRKQNYLQSQMQSRALSVQSRILALYKRGYNNIWYIDMEDYNKQVKASRQFATGGYVSSPTNALVGEGGSEYVIPASKMSAAMERYAAGKRGNEVVPNGNDTQVNVSTGPVMQMNGENYVTQSDFEKGLRSTVNQVMTTLRRSPNTRAAVGI